MVTGIGLPIITIEVTFPAVRSKTGELCGVGMALEKSLEK